MNAQEHTLLVGFIFNIFYGEINYILYILFLVANTKHSV